MDAENIARYLHHLAFPPTCHRWLAGHPSGRAPSFAAATQSRPTRRRTPRPAEPDRPSKQSTRRRKGTRLPSNAKRVPIALRFASCTARPDALRFTDPRLPSALDRPTGPLCRLRTEIGAVDHGVTMDFGSAAGERERHGAGGRLACALGAYTPIEGARVGRHLNARDARRARRAPACAETGRRASCSWWSAPPRAPPPLDRPRQLVERQPPGGGRPP